jgi:hypothetical protein
MTEPYSAGINFLGVVADKPTSNDAIGLLLLHDAVSAMQSALFKIFPPHEAFYLTSLRYCTESALVSAQWLARLYHDHGEGPFDFPSHPALNQVQNIVLQGAAISRFFWPNGEKYEMRGSMLREAFSMDDGNPLHARTLRNRLEHFDEYLDDYLNLNTVGIFVHDYVGPKFSFTQLNPHVFRAFFTDTGEFELMGNIYGVSPCREKLAAFMPCCWRLRRKANAYQNPNEVNKSCEGLGGRETPSSLQCLKGAKISH